MWSDAPGADFSYEAWLKLHAITAGQLRVKIAPDNVISARGCDRVTAGRASKVRLVSTTHRLSPMTALRAGRWYSGEVTPRRSSSAET